MPPSTDIPAPTSRPHPPGQGDDWRLGIPPEVAPQPTTPTTTRPGQPATPLVELTVQPDRFAWPDRPDLLAAAGELPGLLATILLIAGVVWACFGRAMLRTVACLNVAGLGAIAGCWVGEQYGAPLPATVVGGAIGAAVAWPIPRLSVAGCGVLLGFAVGCAVWRSIGLADAYAPAGGLVGAIVLFMGTFISLHGTAAVLAAVQGTLMLVAGLLGLLLKYDEVAEPIVSYTDAYPFALPTLLFALSVVSAFYQGVGPEPSKTKSDKTDA